MDISFTDISPIITQGVTIILTAGGGAWGGIWYWRRLARANAAKAEVEVDASKADANRREIENMGLAAATWRENFEQLKAELARQQEKITKIEEENEEMKRQIKENERQIKELETENSALKNEISRLSAPH